MKKFIITAAIALVSTMSITQVSAQMKIGFINSNEIVSLLPETQAADKSIEAYANELQSALQSQGEKLEKEITEFQNNQKTMTEIMLETKQKEIMSMQQNLQEMQQNANEKLNKKRAELYQPIIEKVEKAIQTVAKSNGYSYVLDTSMGGVLYADEKNDILPLVKKQLNIN